MLSHCFYKELLRCSLVASFCNKAFKNFALMINGASKVKSSTVDFDENFILVPLPIEWRPSLFFRISLANFAPNRFTQNRTVLWQISIPRSCKISSTWRIANVIHNRQADDFWRSLEIFEGVLCCHPEKLEGIQWGVKFV